MMCLFGLFSLLQAACVFVVQVLAGDLPGVCPGLDRGRLGEGKGNQRLEEKELPPGLGMYFRLDV